MPRGSSSRRSSPPRLPPPGAKSGSAGRPPRSGQLPRHRRARGRRPRGAPPRPGPDARARRARDGQERLRADARREASRRERRPRGRCMARADTATAPFAVLQPFSSKVNKEWGADDVVAVRGVAGLRRHPARAPLGTGRREPGGSAHSPFLRKSSLLLSLPLPLFSSRSPRRTPRPARASRRARRSSWGRTRGRRTSRRPPERRRSPSSGRRRPSDSGPVGPRVAVLRESPAAYNRSGGRWPVEDVREAARRLLA